MAKNWTLAEALTALKNYDKAAIADFGKRFPLATNALMEAINGEKLISAIPERVTMRKIEMALKIGVDAEEADDIDDVEEDEAAMKPKKAGRPKKGTAKSDEEKKAAAKARREARKAKAKAAAAEVDDDDDDEDENDYSGMNAVELFKECKKRGISAQPKKPSKYYIDLLNAADAKADEEEDEDDWEDEEEEAPAPKKKAGRPKKAATPVKPAKKATKKVEEDDDDEDEDGDDWDI